MARQDMVVVTKLLKMYWICKKGSMQVRVSTKECHHKAEKMHAFWTKCFVRRKWRQETNKNNIRFHLEKQKNDASVEFGTRRQRRKQLQQWSGFGTKKIKQDHTKKETNWWFTHQKIKKKNQRWQKTRMCWWNHRNWWEPEMFHHAGRSHNGRYHKWKQIRWWWFLQHHVKQRELHFSTLQEEIDECGVREQVRKENQR